MNFSPVFIGILAAIVVEIPQILNLLSQTTLRFWALPSFILGIACLAMLLQRFVFDTRPGARAYDGLADILVHIHLPSSPDSGLRWALRGAISFSLFLFGGVVGIEGAAIETAHALAMWIRPPSSKWFEQRRRTDAACAISAAVAAAFNAPFAAVLLPLELGIGGRTLFSAGSAITAFVVSTWIRSSLHLSTVEAVLNIKFPSAGQWAVVAAIGVLGGVLSYLIIYFIRYLQESLLDLFQRQTWMRTLAGGILLFFVALIYMPGHLSSWDNLQQLFSFQKSVSQVAILAVTQLLALAIALSAFGSMGVFWPIFTLGGFVGFLINALFLKGASAFVATACFVGAAAFWGGIVGAPISASLIAFEMGGSIEIILPCFFAGLISREIRKKMGSGSLFEKDLDARGLPLIEGRSVSLLQQVLVKDAMVTDHDIVHEHEPVAEIYQRILQTHYPFLPVVNTQGVLLGVLTVDMIQEAWRNEVKRADVPLAHILEAKDILYKTKVVSPSVRVNDRLSATQGLFDKAPCIPVVNDEQRVIGLLFVYNVRLAYDREVAKRSMAFERQ